MIRWCKILIISWRIVKSPSLVLLIQSWVEIILCMFVMELTLKAHGQEREGSKNLLFCMKSLKKIGLVFPFRLYQAKEEWEIIWSLSSLIKEDTIWSNISKSCQLLIIWLNRRNSIFSRDQRLLILRNHLRHTRSQLTKKFAKNTKWLLIFNLICMTLQKEKS